MNDLMITRTFDVPVSWSRTRKSTVCSFAWPLVRSVPNRMLRVVEERWWFLLSGRRWIYHADPWYFISPFIVYETGDDPVVRSSRITVMPRTVKLGAEPPMEAWLQFSWRLVPRTPDRLLECIRDRWLHLSTGQGWLCHGDIWIYIAPVAW